MSLPPKIMSEKEIRVSSGGSAGEGSDEIVSEG